MSITLKKTLYVSVAIVALSVVSTIYADETAKAPTAQPVKAKDSNQVVAEIGGEKITFSKFEQLVKSILPKKFHETAFSSPETFEKVLRRVAQLLAIEHAANKSNLMNDAEVKKKIEQAIKLVVQKEYIQREISPSITDDKIKAKYNEVRPNKFTLRHIVVDSKEKALQIVQQLRSGTSFNDLVKQHSIDEDTKNAEQPGYLGPTNTFELREVSPELEKLVTGTAKAAVVSQPFELGENGWSVIRVDNREPMTEADAKDVIKAILASEATKNVVEQALTKGNVKLFGLDGKPVSIQEPKAVAPAPAPSAK